MPCQKIHDSKPSELQAFFAEHCFETMYVVTGIGLYVLSGPELLANILKGASGGSLIGLMVGAPLGLMGGIYAASQIKDEGAGEVMTLMNRGINVIGGFFTGSMGLGLPLGTLGGIGGLVATDPLKVTAISLANLGLFANRLWVNHARQAEETTLQPSFQP